MKKTIDRIAFVILALETLERRNRDSLDFHELSVNQIKRALESAYLAGARSNRTPRERKLATVLKNLHRTGQRLFDALDGTICADEPEFSKFAKALSAASQYLKEKRS
jgi:hypothetical protein